MSLFYFSSNSIWWIFFSKSIYSRFLQSRNYRRQLFSTLQQRKEPLATLMYLRECISLLQLRVQLRNATTHTLLLRVFHDKEFNECYFFCDISRCLGTLLQPLIIFRVDSLYDAGLLATVGVSPLQDNTWPTKGSLRTLGPFNPQRVLFARWGQGTFWEPWRMFLRLHLKFFLSNLRRSILLASILCLRFQLSYFSFPNHYTIWQPQCTSSLNGFFNFLCLALMTFQTA